MIKEASSQNSFLFSKYSVKGKRIVVSTKFMNPNEQSEFIITILWNMSHSLVNSQIMLIKRAILKRTK